MNEIDTYFDFDVDGFWFDVLCMAWSFTGSVLLAVLMYVGWLT